MAVECNSNDCCQWSSPCCACSVVKLLNSSCTCSANSSKPSMSPSTRPSHAAKGTRKMRVAPGLVDWMTPSAFITITPAVRLSRIVCKFAREVCTCIMLLSSASRVSESCCVMSANERVKPSNSSRPCNAGLGLKSPAATSRTPAASIKSGRANWLPNNTAKSTAPNTAKNKLKVSVPMYMLRKPSRPKARSWYSR